MDRKIHFELNISSKCENSHSYGVICVRCGRCGRKFNKNGFLAEEIKNEEIYTRELSKEEIASAYERIEEISTKIKIKYVNDNLEIEEVGKEES